jgi:hypothetical protein
VTGVAASLCQEMGTGLLIARAQDRAARDDLHRQAGKGSRRERDRAMTGGENHRYWDLIDLQLLQALTGENLAPVKDACRRIFAARGRQPCPPHVTTCPDWSDRYVTMASSLDMPIIDLDEAVDAIHAFIHAIDTS